MTTKRTRIMTRRRKRSNAVTPLRRYAVGRHDPRTMYTNHTTLGVSSHITLGDSTFVIFGAVGPQLVCREKAVGGQLTHALSIEGLCQVGPLLVCQEKIVGGR